MNEFQMANEPTTKQKRKLVVTLNNLQATAQVTLLNKDDGKEILKGEAVPVNIGQHFGMPGQEEESEITKAAREKLVSGVEGLVAEYFQTVNQ